MTRYGRTMTEQLVSEMAGAGITTVSGFMYGIDAVAHEAAANASGKTIAVMPCGIEKIHPEHQEELYGKILQTRGLILSEYEGDMPPALWTYPKRNRIVAGLSPLLLVIEAGLKSGALITARIAQKYNKKIYALPGPLTSSVSRGTALLIQQGASIVTGAEDILREYGHQPGSPRNGGRKPGKMHLNALQKSIVQQLSREELTADEITRQLAMPTSQIGAELTVLTLKKVLTCQEGRYFLTGNEMAGGVLC